MIKTLDVELKILVYILSFGIYYFAASDLLIYIVDRKKQKKLVKILFEIIYLISQVYITFNFCYNLDNGYIPIYFMIFIIIGFMLYYLFANTLLYITFLVLQTTRVTNIIKSFYKNITRII